MEVNDGTGVLLHSPNLHKPACLLACLCHADQTFIMLGYAMKEFSYMTAECFVCFAAHMMASLLASSTVST